MLHQHRCGSSVLGTMLGTHPEVTWRSEVLTFDRMRWESIGGTVADWPCRPWRLIDHKRWEMPQGWFGCEITHRNVSDLGLSMQEVIDTAAAKGFSRFIVLERRNHLRRYVSSRIGAARGKLHHNLGEAIEPIRAEIDTLQTGLSCQRSPLLERLQRDHDSMQEMLALTRPYGGLHLVYEDHVEQDPTVAYRMTCEHLGLAPERVEPALQRGNPQPIRELIKDCGPVERALRGTRFEWMLDA